MKNRTPTREKSATISTRPKLEAGEGYIYGRRPVMEILRRRPEALRQIYYRLGSSFLEDLSAIHYKAGKTHFTTRAVSEEELDSWTDGGNHQGLFAVFLERPESTLEAIVEAIDDLVDKKQDFADRVEELTGTSEYMPQSSLPAASQQFKLNMPAGYIVEGTSGGAANGVAPAQTCNINGVEMPGKCEDYQQR